MEWKQGKAEQRRIRLMRLSFELNGEPATPSWDFDELNDLPHGDAGEAAVDGVSEYSERY